VALAEPFAPDAPLVALALEDRRELRDYFERLRTCVSRSAVQISSPSGYPSRRRIGRILAAIRTRKLNGELDGREAELAAARELVAASTPREDRDAAEVAARYARVRDEVGPV
jgi:hypothetical protein